MIISMVTYRETFFPISDLTRILVIITYNALHQIQLELQTNSIYVHSNLGGATHGYLQLLTTNTKYATLSNIPYVCPAHSGIILISNNATQISAYKIDENLRVFHKVRRVEHALIQQDVIAANKQYTISTNKRNAGKFTGNIRHIFA